MMEGDQKIPLSHKSRRGSETRQKQRRITFRVTAEEYATLETAAGAAGLTLGSHIRDCTLKAPQTRARRRASVEVQALAALLAQLSKMGSNVHQILKRLNFDEIVLREDFGFALKNLDEAAGVVMRTLGRGGPS